MSIQQRPGVDHLIGFSAASERVVDADRLSLACSTCDTAISANECQDACELILLVHKNQHLEVIGRPDFNFSDAHGMSDFDFSPIFSSVVGHSYNPCQNRAQIAVSRAA